MVYCVDNLSLFSMCTIYSSDTLSNVKKNTQGVTALQLLQLFLGLHIT